MEISSVRISVFSSRRELSKLGNIIDDYFKIHCYIFRKRRKYPKSRLSSQSVLEEALILLPPLPKLWLGIMSLQPGFLQRRASSIDGGFYEMRIEEWSNVNGLLGPFA